MSDYELGKNAWKAGKLFSANPYNIATAPYAWQDWADGWCYMENLPLYDGE